MHKLLLTCSIIVYIKLSNQLIIKPQKNKNLKMKISKNVLLSDNEKNKNIHPWFYELNAIHFHIKILVLLVCNKKKKAFAFKFKR